MSDSKDTNELDSYGVWVKTPPKTIDSSDTTNQTADTFSFDTDLPDFSNLDVIDSVSADSDYDNADTALSTEELFNITSNVENAGDFTSLIDSESSTQNSSNNSSGEEEISLDEFIEGGVFETGPDEDKIKEKEAETAHDEPLTQNETSEKTEETVSFDDDFTVESDETENIAPEEPVVAESSNQSDDDIFNIDLSFDDDSSATTSEKKEIPQTEEMTVNFDSPAGTEDVDLSEFGFDDDSTETPEQNSSQVAVSEADNGGMENIDLSEFGFEDTDSDSPEKAQSENNFATENEVSEKEQNIEIPQEENTVTQQETETTAEVVAENSDSDDDFDLDSILGNITDENGNTSSLADFEEPVQSATETQEEINESEFTDFTGEAESEEIKEPELTDIPAEIIAEEPAVTEIPETSLDSTEEIQETIVDDNLSNEIQPETETTQTVEPNEVEIPDTFEEETSTLLEEDAEKANEFASSITAPVLSENELETEKPSAQMTAIFSQIVEELSSLKNEFASLKNEIETIKNQTKSPITVEEQKKEENHGFFADTDEDDTIALSTDELDNILQTADITQAEPQPAPQEEQTVLTEETEITDSAEIVEENTTETPTEEPVSSQELLGNAEEIADFAEEDFEASDDFSTTFEESTEDSGSAQEEIEEPVLDELDYSGIENNSNLPEEISVPKADDILVESSSTDLLETSDETSDAQKIEEPYSFEELMKEEPSIEETLTEEKLDYLSSSPEENSPAENIEDATEELLEDNAELEDFNFEEVQEENPAPAEAQEVEEFTTENTESSEPEKVEKAEDNNGLSGDLKTEIKSVLSYMDQLLENLPEDKIAEFAQSQQFDTYKKLFKELGLA